MNELVFEALKVIVMLAALLVARYLIPFIKTKISTEQMGEVKMWVNAAVLMVQQVYGTEPGTERKKIALDLLNNMLLKENIRITSDQLDTLIEAAVKTMKMQEG